MSVRATLPNPFRQRTISDLWQPPEVDYPSLHQISFENCCLAFAQLRAASQTSSLLLYGEAGNGKSHMLARMLTRFEQANSDSNFIEAEGWTLCAINLQSVSKLTWQHLQTCLVNDLLRMTPSGLTQLERLLLCRMTHYGLVEGESRAWLERMRKDARSITAFFKYFEEIFEAIDPDCRIDNDMRLVLRNLLLGFNDRTACAWLRGEALHPLVLDQLNLKPLPVEENALEKHAQAVVLGLLLLVTPQLPFVICFDQVEALQAHPDDEEGLERFLQIYDTLRTDARCTLFITSTQSQYRDPLRKALRKLEARHEAELNEAWLAPLTWREAQHLITLRLNSVPALARLREERHDPFWPLDEADILTVIGYQARQLFAHCALLYEQSRPVGTSGALHSVRNSGNLSSGHLPEAQHQQFKKIWQEQYDKIFPEMREDDRFDERLPRCLASLIGYARPEWRLRTDELPRDVDLLFEGSEYNVYITLVNHTHLPSYTKRIQRILERFYGHRTYELVLTRDSRRTFGPMSRTPRKLREEIIEKGATWIDVTPEVQAALETLHHFATECAQGDQGSRGVCDWAVNWPVPELRQWLLEIFPLTMTEEISRKIATGELRTNSGDLRLPSGPLKMPSGDLKLPSGGLKIPSGDLKFPSGGLKYPSGEIKFRSGEFKFDSFSTGKLKAPDGE
jgi:hypothetical protein